MNAAGLASGVDPTIVVTLRLFLAAIFARALLAKVRAPREFVAVIGDYQLLPAFMSGTLAAVLLTVELGLIVGLLSAAAAPMACAAAAGLLLVYAAAIGINLARGRRDIDCGCAGPHQRQPLHELLIARNFFYAAVALLAASTPVPRSWVWLDFATIGLAFFALAVLAIALDGIAARAAAYGWRSASA